jgi:hypothetical protein
MNLGIAIPDRPVALHEIKPTVGDLADETAAIVPQGLRDSQAAQFGFALTMTHKTFLGFILEAFQLFVNGKTGRKRRRCPTFEHTIARSPIIIYNGPLGRVL